MAAENVTVIRYRPADSDNDKRLVYFIEMLELALHKTRDEFGEYSLEPAPVPISQARAFDLVRRGRYVDIVWGMTSTERESMTLPVRIPLLKGLLGYRVLLVHASQMNRIKAVASLEDLGSMTGIQGLDWPDTTILKANNLNILTSSDYESLFKMVTAGRADYFPRSVAEVWSEIDSFSGQGLVPSPSPILFYEGPIYFFVNPQNTKLAGRLTLGLKRAIEDGSFDKLFYSQKDINRAIDFLNKGSPTVIRVPNPYLPDATPLNDTRLWFQWPE
jgi:hypothetical protein